MPCHESVTRGIRFSGKSTDRPMLGESGGDGVDVGEKPIGDSVPKKAHMSESSMSSTPRPKPDGSDSTHENGPDCWVPPLPPPGTMPL